MGLDNDGAYYANISKNVASQSKTNFSAITGAYINNSKSNKTQAVYYFEATGTTVKEIQNQINILEKKLGKENKKTTKKEEDLDKTIIISNSQDIKEEIKEELEIKKTKKSKTSNKENKKQNNLDNNHKK